MSPVPIKASKGEGQCFEQLTVNTAMNAVLQINHLDDLKMRKRGRFDADEDAGIVVRTLKVLGCLSQRR